MRHVERPFFGTEGKWPGAGEFGSGAGVRKGRSRAGRGGEQFWVDILPERAHLLVICRPKNKTKNSNFCRARSIC